MADTKRPWDHVPTHQPAADAGAAKPERASRRGLLRGMAVAMGAVTTGALTARGAMSRTPDTAARPRFPHAFHGVSVIVADIDRAVRFYERVLGASVLAARTDVARGSVAGQRLSALTHGRADDGWVACLSLANGVGLELFQPAGVRAEEVRGAAPLHLAVTDPDVNAFVAEVELLGGERLGPTLDVADGAGYHRAFVRDPNGITLEVVSVSFEQALANVG